uniref:PDZ and LIM domain protein 2 n=1 Tax=Zosterops lateralis melanops TaxID=1220523 RepID=A0A8D2NS68_ZOSLA
GSCLLSLSHPAPWERPRGGWGWQGGDHPPFSTEVTELGKAAAGGLRPGDVIVTINGQSAAEMLHVEAQNKIKQMLGTALTAGPGCQRCLQAAGGPQTLNHLPLNPKTLSPQTPPSAPPGPPPRPSPLSLRVPVWGLSPPRPSPGLEGAGGERPLGWIPEFQLWEHPPPQKKTISPGFFPHSQSSEPAMRRLEEDSEVYKMLQERRELRAAPRQSSTFRLLQEALEDEEGGGPAAPFPSRLSAGARKPLAGVQKLHVCEKCGSSIATQAVRIQEGRYRHPSCYTCADCGLSLKMRGHFWVGDELFCEKHARLRYQGPPGGPVPRPVSPHS